MHEENTKDMATTISDLNQKLNMVRHVKTLFHYLIVAETQC